MNTVNRHQWDAAMLANDFGKQIYETPVQKHVREQEHANYLRRFKMAEVQVKTAMTRLNNAKTMQLDAAETQELFQKFTEAMARQDWINTRRGGCYTLSPIRATL